MLLTSADTGRRAGRAWLMAGLVGLVFFVALAPTLSVLEFTNAGESYVIQTALEMRRGGSWLVPTLQGRERIAKPPLPAWIAAASVSQRTLEQIGSPEAAVRAAGHRRLAWEIRWPALLAACLAVAAIVGLGTLLAGRGKDGLAGLGMWAGLIAGSNLLFLRLAPAATTDVHLTLWVAMAQLFLALALLREKRWLGCIGAGVALGLAMVCKGPVALVQVLAPLPVFWVWWWWTRDRGALRPSLRRWLGPVAAGLMLMLGIGLSWYGVVLARVPGALHRWRVELALDEETTRPGGDPIWAYLILLPLMLPWVVFFLGGVVQAIEKTSRKGVSSDRAGAVLAGCWLIVALVLMSCFPDRKPRYLLPLLGPAAVLGAMSIADYLRRPAGDVLRRWAGGAQWTMLLILGIGAALVAWKWLSPLHSLAVLAGAGTLLGAGVWLARRWAAAPLYATVVLMLGLYPLGLIAYAGTAEGRSAMRPLAELVWEKSPMARVSMYRPGRVRLPNADLAIYLNRPVFSGQDPAQMTATAQPQVVVQREKPGYPLTLPPGWQHLGAVRDDEDTWHVLLLPAK